MAIDADTTIVILVPESGDSIQALKAGLSALPSSPELLARLGQIERGGR